MSFFARIRDLFRQKATAAIDRAEDPREALEVAYRQQLEEIARVRRSVADVLTSQKRLEIEAAQLEGSEGRLRADAMAALQRSDEDSARRLLMRANSSKRARAQVERYVADIRDQERSLEDLLAQLQSRVEMFRAQKEAAKAQYTASAASVRAGESVTGLSDNMQDVAPMVERARQKILDLQARAAAVGELASRGASDDQTALAAGEDRQALASDVDADLSLMKRQLTSGQPPL